MDAISAAVKFPESERSSIRSSDSRDGPAPAREEPSVLRCKAPSATCLEVKKRKVQRHVPGVPCLLHLAVASVLPSTCIVRICSEPPPPFFSLPMRQRCRFCRYHRLRHCCNLGVLHLHAFVAPAPHFPSGHGYPCTSGPCGKSVMRLVGACS